MKHRIWICTVGIGLGLSACATQYVTHEMGAKQGHVAADYQYRVILEDQLVAIGTPKAKLAQHEGAWVLVGKRHSYLMTVQGKTCGLFAASFAQRGRALFAHSKGNTPRWLGRGIDCRAARARIKLFEQVRLDYRKPLAQVSAAERQRSQGLGFYCNAISSSGVYDCSLGLKCAIPHHHCCPTNRQQDSPLCPATPVQNHAAQRWQSHRLRPRHGHKKPCCLLALVVDVVTMPCAIAGRCSGTRCGAQSVGLRSECKRPVKPVKSVTGRLVRRKLLQ